jgi:hypothetical protein
MSDIGERSSITNEVLGWSEVEGKHAQMHLVRRATLMAIEQIVEHVGVDEHESNETRQSYLPVRPWHEVLRRPHEVVRRGHGERLIVSNRVFFGYLDDPENPMLPYKVAKIEEIGGFNFEETARRLDPKQQPKDQRDTYYRPNYNIRYFAYAGTIPGAASAEKEIPGTDIRMLDDTNLDVRFHAQWSPESMVKHYDRQIGQLAVFMDGLTEIAQAAGAYIHHGTELSYFLDPEEVARHRGV